MPHIRELPLALVASIALLVGACNPGASPSGSAAPSAAASAPITMPALANVSLDGTRAAQASIGPAGGSLDATDANGATYHLEIPERAMLEQATIAIAPIEGIEGLPEKAAIAAGVHLLPDGQHFAVPATLTLTLPSMPAGGVLGLAYRGDMVERGLYPIETAENTITLTLFHFSGYAALMATDEAVDALTNLGLALTFQLGPEPTTDQALGAIAAALQQRETDLIGAAVSADAALAAWLRDEIRPAVQRFLAITSFNGGDPFFQESLTVQADLLAFHYVMKLLIVSGLAPAHSEDLDRTRAELARSAANHAIEIANKGCTDPAEGLTRATWSVYWQAWAKDLQVDDGSLAFDAVFAQLCLRPVFSPEDGAVFPEALQPGGEGDLRLHLGYTVVDRSSGTPVDATPVYDLVFEVAVTPTGTIPGDVIHATTDTGGRLAHAFLWVPDEPALQLRVDACFADSLTTSLIRFMCVTTIIDRSEGGGSGGATAVSYASTSGRVGCVEWIPANQCTRWATTRPENASQFWLEPKSGSEPGEMSMSANQEFKVDETRLANGALTSVTISGTFSATTSGGGVASTGAEYSVSLRDVATLKWRGTVSGNVVGVRVSDETNANTLAGVGLSVTLGCGDDIEYTFEKVAGSGYDASAGGSDAPGATLDVDDDYCTASLDVHANVSSNNVAAPGQSGSATITFSVTFEMTGTGGGELD